MQAIIAENFDSNENPGVAKIQVNNSRKALARIAKRYHGNPDESISIVGITGTNGKTTVSTMTRHLLEEPGRPVGLIVQMLSLGR